VILVACASGLGIEALSGTLRLQVLDYNAINEAPEEELKRLCAFLGVDSTFVFDTGVILNSRENRCVCVCVRARVCFFAPLLLRSFGPSVPDRAQRRVRALDPASLPPRRLTRALSFPPVPLGDLLCQGRARGVVDGQDRRRDDINESHRRGRHELVTQGGALRDHDPPGGKQDRS